MPFSGCSVFHGVNFLHRHKHIIKKKAKNGFERPFQVSEQLFGRKDYEESKE